MSIVLNRAVVNIDLIFDHHFGQFLKQIKGWKHGCSCALRSWKPNKSSFTICCSPLISQPRSQGFSHWIWEFNGKSPGNEVAHLLEISRRKLNPRVLLFSDNGLTANDAVTYCSCSYCCCTRNLLFADSLIVCRSVEYLKWRVIYDTYLW